MVKRRSGDFESNRSSDSSDSEDFLNNIAGDKVPSKEYGKFNPAIREAGCGEGTSFQSNCGMEQPEDLFDSNILKSVKTYSRNKEPKQPPKSNNLFSIQQQQVKSRKPVRKVHTNKLYFQEVSNNHLLSESYSFLPNVVMPTTDLMKRNGTVPKANTAAKKRAKNPNIVNGNNRLEKTCHDVSPLKRNLAVDLDSNNEDSAIQGPKTLNGAYARTRKNLVERRKSVNVPEMLNQTECAKFDDESEKNSNSNVKKEKRNSHFSVSTEDLKDLDQSIETFNCSKGSKLSKSPASSHTPEPFSVSNLILNSPSKTLKVGKNPSIIEVVSNKTSNSQPATAHTSVRPSLMDMVRRFSSNPNVISNDSSASLYNNESKPTKQKVRSTSKKSSNVMKKIKSNVILEEEMIEDQMPCLNQNNTLSSSLQQKVQLKKPNNLPKKAKRVKQTRDLQLNSTVKSSVNNLEKFSFQEPFQLGPRKRKKSKNVANKDLLMKFGKELGVSVSDSCSPSNNEAYDDKIICNENDLTNFVLSAKSPQKRNSECLKEKVKKKQKTAACSNKDTNEISMIDVVQNNLVPEVAKLPDSLQHNENCTFPPIDPEFVEPEQINSFLDSLAEGNNFSDLTPIQPINTHAAFCDNLTGVNTQAQFLPNTSIPSTLMGTYVLPELNNGLSYINPVQSYQPMIPNPGSNNVVIMPMPCANCQQVPNASALLSTIFSNTTSAAPPVIQLSIDSSNVGSVLGTIAKFYKPTMSNVLDVGNISVPTTLDTNNMQCFNVPGTSSSTLNANSGSVHVPQPTQVVENIPSSYLNDYVRSERYEPDLDSDTSVSDSDILVDPCTKNSMHALGGHFNDLINSMKNFSFKQCESYAIRLFESHFSFSQHPPVKKFFTDENVDLVLSHFNCGDHQASAYRFMDNFEDLDLGNVLKGYVSFHTKEIVDALQLEPFTATRQLVLEQGNSKLNYSEKLLMKRIFHKNKDLNLKDLIEGLSFIGLIVLFWEFKKRQVL